MNLIVGIAALRTQRTVSRAVLSFKYSALVVLSVTRAKCAMIFANNLVKKFHQKRRLGDVMKIFFLLGLISLLVACDDGTLPFSQYEKVDVNVYFYFPSGDEVFLGETKGASSCGSMAHSYASEKQLSRNRDWSYICCTIQKGSSCYHKIR